MTLTTFLDLFERITLLPTKRSVTLFIQNELKPLEATESGDNRFRDLMYSANTRRNYLTR